MIKKFFKSLMDKISCAYKERKEKLAKLKKIKELELTMKRYEGFKTDEDSDKWFEAYIEYCALTESKAYIYTTYVRKKEEVLANGTNR